MATLKDDLARFGTVQVFQRAHECCQVFVWYRQNGTGACDGGSYSEPTFEDAARAAIRDADRRATRIVGRSGGL